ncbi:type II toxin-antitoxin system Phd/YefM family antitoxin [Levilactobacillus wangkuiensis]|uniref:type II toxin-antitoxin system Phd/YefM family antitoxin n=1 Tax=Levilactobacillus wangkuiensis TaxID=2799566 RepID=UPI0019403B29|nr:type II toxin-antitoxin system prevent-host-death family antitoxin [Levilactobacillus wangkuiensis]
MQAVNYSNFRQNLKSYLQTINEDSEPFIVTTKDSKDDVVVLSVEEYDSLVETAKITSNAYLMDKIRRSDKQFSQGQFKEHELIDEDADE